MEKYNFISHSSKDGAIATQLCKYLENHGKICFIAPRNIRSGRDYAEEIIDGIDNSQAMILLLSNHSNQSAHVLREVERAVSKSIPIITYKIEEVELSKSLEYFLMTNQWMDSEKSRVFSNILECINDIEELKNSRTDEQESGLEPEEREKKITLEADRTKSKIFVAVAGILAAACLTGAVLFFWKGNDSLTDRTTENAAVENNTNESDNMMKDIKVGDTLSFGTYNEEPIEWRVLKLSEDKKEAVLITKYIISMKAYDAAESGAYNYVGSESYWAKDSEANSNMALQAKVRGNSDWSTSNIRTWLNSQGEVVTYSDQAPAAAAMSEKKNEYSLEAGFLYGFSEKEREAIQEVENTTKGNELAKGNMIKTTDRVYLLSIEELKWFEEAEMSMLAEPTKAAVEQDKTKWYQNLYVDQTKGNTNYCWWLREPVEGFSSRCYLVGNGFMEENLWTDKNVGVEGYGIRPAITVNLEKINMP
ncbi:MAG: toll/interleukin-1 receptor domain-containing protein [Lachnospiraceae bacterium]|nr:toll/interleukin-1 receptor domain-containing protein [Lachnospiraceae bacterium]